MPQPNDKCTCGSGKAYKDCCGKPKYDAHWASTLNRKGGPQTRARLSFKSAKRRQQSFISRQQSFIK
jgi:hypothetical protein